MWLFHNTRTLPQLFPQQHQRNNLIAFSCYVSSSNHKAFSCKYQGPRSLQIIIHHHLLRWVHLKNIKRRTYYSFKHKIKCKERSYAPLMLFPCNPRSVSERSSHSGYIKASLSYPYWLFWNINWKRKKQQHHNSSILYCWWFYLDFETL